MQEYRLFIGCKGRWIGVWVEPHVRMDELLFKKLDVVLGIVEGWVVPGVRRIRLEAPRPRRNPSVMTIDNQSTSYRL